jgi:Bacterial TniB protein
LPGSKAWLIIDEIHSMLSGTFREQRIFLNALLFSQ